MRRRYDDRDGSIPRRHSDHPMVSPMTPPMRHQPYHGEYHGNYMGQFVHPYDPNPYTPPYHHHNPHSSYEMGPGRMGPMYYGHGMGRGGHIPMRQPMFDDMMNSNSSYSSKSVARRPIYEPEDDETEEDKGKIPSYFERERDL